MTLDDQTILDLLRRQSTCSIEFGRTSKGDPSWTIKQYHQVGQEAVALAHIAAIDTALTAIFIAKRDPGETIVALQQAEPSIAALTSLATSSNPMPDGERPATDAEHYYAQDAAGMAGGATTN
jgi:hypothetical protein